MTKKPTTAPATPATSVLRGAPEPVADRAGTTYFPTVPATSRTVRTPATLQRAAPPPAQAHATPAAHTSSRPGSTGTTTPARPTSITSRTRSSAAGDTCRRLRSRGPLGLRRPPAADVGISAGPTPMEG